MRGKNIAEVILPLGEPDWLSQFVVSNTDLVCRLALLQ